MSHQSQTWFKTIGLSLAFIMLTACGPQNEKKYANNPKALQTALKKCPEKAPKHVSCTELSEIATRINQLAYKLRVDQQAYGKDILALQETITMQRSTLEKNPKEAELQKDLKKNERTLQEHLAVVRWLASPERH